MSLSSSNKRKNDDPKELGKRSKTVDYSIFLESDSELEDSSETYEETSSDHKASSKSTEQETSMFSSILKNTAVLNYLKQEFGEREIENIIHKEKYSESELQKLLLSKKICDLRKHFGKNLSPAIAFYRKRASNAQHAQRRRYEDKG